MQYRQDTKVKSNQKQRRGQSGQKIEQIVFQKQITQHWKVHTSVPTQLLPYAIKHLGLSRMCEFWHQLKFLYFQNYHQTSHKIQSQIQVQEYEQSIIVVRHSSERIEQCKRFIKSLWKITRLRLLMSMNKLKLEAGLEDESSLELEEEKLDTYMRFLKLQENKRIDLAIQNLDSVVEKNTRRKLLGAFLNMRQRLKDERRAEVYRDRIKLECFIDIVMRGVRKLNHYTLSETFADCYEYTRHVQLKNEHSQLSAKGKDNQNRNNKHETQRPPQLDKYSSTSKTNTRQESMNEKNIQNRHEQTKQRDTINKNNRKANGTAEKQHNLSTIKRRQVQQKRQQEEENLLHSNIKSIESHEQVIESHYYYEDSDEEAQGQGRNNMHSRNNKNVNINMNNMNNMNSLPTRRVSTNSYDQNIENHYQVNEIYQNINSQIIHKKTARTPSRTHIRQNSHQSEINKNTYHSQQLLNNQFNDTNTRSQNERKIIEEGSHPGSNQKNTELHIPITQRFEKHYHHEEHYEEEEEQSQDLSQNNIHQQICVIRNFSTTPQRTPDRYEKIPIVSNNIEFRQFFVNSTKKKTQSHHSEMHSMSYYERQCCEGCQYCTRLKRIDEMVKQISKQKNQITKESQMSKQLHHNQRDTIITKEKIIHQSRFIKGDEALTKKQIEPNNLVNSNLITQSTNLQNNHNQKQQKQEGQFKNSQVNKQSNVRSISRTKQTNLQQSVFSESTKGLSEKKQFARKPMH